MYILRSCRLKTSLAVYIPDYDSLTHVRGDMYVSQQTITWVISRVQPKFTLHFKFWTRYWVSHSFRGQGLENSALGFPVNFTP